MPEKTFIALVKCDSCSWFSPKENVYDWYLKSCPVCGYEPIISEEDIAMVRATEATIVIAESMGFKAEQEHLSDPRNSDQLVSSEDGPPGSFRVHIDTSSLRKK